MNHLEPVTENQVVLQNLELAPGLVQYPISEIFGPTIQGEGPLIGVKTHFVRFAGCGHDCDWCDTKYAVHPKYAGFSRSWMSAQVIHMKLHNLGLRTGEWITMSGGDPALFVDLPLLKILADYKIAMETQGAVALPADVSVRIKSLVVSPKPPSSGMASRFNLHKVQDLLVWRMHSDLTSLKFVVFNEEDLEWTKERLAEIKPGKHVGLFLSIGTPLNLGIDQDDPMYLRAVRSCIMNDWAMWADRIVNDPILSKFRLLPQLHTLAWGQKRGK